MKLIKPKAFISGNVSGLPYYVAYETFSNAERMLSAMGYKVINPTKLCKKNWSWLRCMAVCLWNLMWCDCIYQLENWRDSKGARIEYKLAKMLNKNIKSLCI